MTEEILENNSGWDKIYDANYFDVSFHCLALLLFS